MLGLFQGLNRLLKRERLLIGIDLSRSLHLFLLRLNRLNRLGLFHFVSLLGLLGVVGDDIRRLLLQLRIDVQGHRNDRLDPQIRESLDHTIG